MLYESQLITFPGRIVDFSATDQTATVKLCAERGFDTSEGLNEVVDRVLIHNVPVQFPFGGGWSLTMPIAPDDTCLLIFSQVGYDHWLMEDKDVAGKLAGLPAPHLKRQFSPMDGFCIVGFNTIPRAIQNFSAADSQWRDSAATQKISLNADGTITLDSTTSVTVTAPETTVAGNLTVTGTVTSQGLVTAQAGTSVTGNISVTGTVDGVDIAAHTHPGDSGGNTGAPN
jgi:hypothetical protein